jgi:hypothetical protein
MRGLNTWHIPLNTTYLVGHSISMCWVEYTLRRLRKFVALLARFASMMHIIPNYNASPLQTMGTIASLGRNHRFT